MSSKKRSSSKKKKSTAAPAIPPTLIRLFNEEDFEKYVVSLKGSALVAVVSPINATTCSAVLSGLEQLNSNRGPALAETNLCVVFANKDSAALCERLQVSTSPYFESFSYGNSVFKFSGDSMEKAVLIATHASQAAVEEGARLAQEAANAEA
ncbi:hypothetical protein ADEAN_000417800 [Angomonas deanei]|uniref:Uncharacterized protein n=1 Tax=Angomonas deanei TaxID=59799 RepID=A0A7G2CCN5_9TRYP|nr:hypothetical protein ADEAN_000417800 [Angomonas deanei]